MKVIKILKQIAFSLGILGFISSLFLCAQTLGLGMQTDELKAIRFGSSPNLGLTIFEELALRYCLISVCFLLFILLLLVRNQVLSKVISLIPLVFMILQCRFLIIIKTKVLQGKWAYANWLEVTYYIDFGFLALAIVLLILQLYLIQLIYRLPVYDSPQFHSVDGM